MDRFGYALLGFILALALWAGFIIGRRTAPVADPVTITETIVVRDTLTEYEPVPVYVERVDTLLVPVTEWRVIHDTTYIALPREIKRYEGKNYVAVISGYEPRLEEVSVFPEKTTSIVERVVKTPPAFTLSASVGMAENWGDVPTFMQGIVASWSPSKRVTLSLAGGYSETPLVRSAPFIGAEVRYNFLVR